jgi:choice-of-anchor B domain-containing protein
LTDTTCKFSVTIFFAILSPGLILSQEILNMSLLSQVEVEEMGNDVWTYVDDEGRDYVIAGNRANSQIYDITDPKDPILMAEIPGARSVWRDFKSFDQYLYVVADQGRDGVTIIDMSNPQDTITFEMWTDTITIDGISEVIQTCHNIYIDTLIGYAYLAGCNNGAGGVITLDLNTDPTNPTVIGVQDQAYAHDVIVRDELMYTSEILGGVLAVYDVSDPADALFLNRIATSTVFTHNAWLSDDNQFIFTTDERGNAFVDAYDISDVNNIQRVDQYRPVDDPGILPHNTHYFQGFLVTSWYNAGVIVLDAHRPHNLIRVAQYDTNPQNANGNWGVSPYLPSGTIVATDIDNGLFMLEADYQRAAYLEGIVVDSLTGLPVNGATVEILSDLALSETTNPRGEFATGIPESGTFQVVISHPNYAPDTITVTLVQGELNEVRVALMARNILRVTGTVISEDDSPIEDARVSFRGEVNFDKNTNELGAYTNDVFEGDYEVIVGKWGFQYLYDSVSIGAASINDYQLVQGFEDHFDLELNWNVSGAAATGRWVRAIPLETTFSGVVSNPGTDSPNDQGSWAYVTGNADDSAAVDDVDGGPTILLSPPLPLYEFEEPVIEFDYWFFNDGGNSAPNDTMIVSLIAGNEEIVVLELSDSNAWETEQIIIRDWTDSTQVSLQFSVTDEAPGHLLEAGVDNFTLFDDVRSSVIDNRFGEISIFPNPATTSVQVLDAPDRILSAQLLDVLGRTYPVLIDGTELIFNAIPTGQYFLRLRDEADQTYISKLQIIRN